MHLFVMEDGKIQFLFSNEILALEISFDCESTSYYSSGNNEWH